MRCSACNYKDTKVIDSRLVRGGLSVRRRRECEKCGHRFSTGEDVELLDIGVIKRDGRRESYVRAKLESGVRKSLEKRPYLTEDFAHLIRVIERDIGKKKKREVKSEEIGEIIMRRLRSFDKVAYIRFASVYRNFSDVDTFAQAAKELKLPKRKNSKKRVLAKK